jgi:hypothetical protein
MHILRDIGDEKPMMCLGAGGWGSGVVDYISAMFWVGKPEPRDVMEAGFREIARAKDAKDAKEERGWDGAA